MQKYLQLFKQAETGRGQASPWIDFLKRNEYPDASAVSAAAKLDALPTDLQEALLRWDKSGELPDLEAEGFTLRELMDYKGLTEIAAILMLDWLRREPEAAKLALAEPADRLEIGAKERKRLAECEAADQGD